MRGASPSKASTDRETTAVRRQGDQQLSSRIFVHGVPDTPAVWDPLLAVLGGDTAAPRLPGFGSPAPAGFTANKDAYAEWLVTLLEAEASRTGPVDLVGHDWGALLTLRAASLRPDLVRTWTISGALIDPDYSGHTVARIWNTPVLGEIAMTASPRGMMTAMLQQAGLPPEVARTETAAWGADMKAAILALYRSADGLRFRGDWISRLAELPRRGLLIWGERDPYMVASLARTFAATRDLALHIEAGAGHWVIAERPEAVARALLAHWAD